MQEGIRLAIHLEVLHGQPYRSLGDFGVQSNPFNFIWASSKQWGVYVVNLETSTKGKFFDLYS